MFGCPLLNRVDNRSSENKEEEMKHTGRGWIAVGKSIKSDIDHGKRYTIARADSHGRFLPGYDEANAKVMAASSDLLATCEHLCKTIKPYIMSLGVKKGFSEMVALTEAEKAIAKAKGELT